jgi:hypothetical protein
LLNDGEVYDYSPKTFGINCHRTLSIPHQYVDKSSTNERSLSDIDWLPAFIELKLFAKPSAT